MPELHTIRLHGPWNAKVLSNLNQATTDDFNLEKRVKIPSSWHDWLGPSFAGQVSYERTFNRPTRLDADQKVWLVVEAVDHLATIFLNGEELGAMKFGGLPLRVDVLAMLQPANRLRIEISSDPSGSSKENPSSAGGLIGSVRLEIE
ncbi:MAG: sugar-binding domain-containing protein [Mariniblastus sp.]